MRRICKAAIWIILCVCFAPTAYAVDFETEQRNALGIGGVESALPESASELMQDISAADIKSAETVLSRVAGVIGDKLGSIVKKSSRNAGVILIIILLCSILRTVNDCAVDAVNFGAVLAIGAVSASDAGSFMGLGRETLFQLSDFSKVLLPSLSAAASASGAVTSASAKYAVSALFMDVVLNVEMNILMPMVYAYVAAIIANAAFGGDALSGVAELLKWLCKTILTGLVIAFTAYLGLTGIITGSADAVTTRVTKTAISTLLPVVGGIVSDAAGAVISGAAVLRNALGIFGILAVLCTCLIPFLTLGANYLFYRLAAGVSSVLTDKRLSGLISGMGTAFGIVLAIVGTGAIVLFFSIISCIKAVGAI